MALSKAALAARKPKPVERRIESLGETVFFRQLSALDRLKVFELFQKAGESQVDQARVCYVIVSLSAVEENGTRIFASGDEVGEFGEDVTQELVKEAMEVNGFSGDAVEEEAKN